MKRNNSNCAPYWPRQWQPSNSRGAGNYVKEAIIDAIFEDAYSKDQYKAELGAIERDAAVHAARRS